MTDTPQFLDHIAYRKLDGTPSGVIFLHGYRSDMFGTKAVALETWAQDWGCSYLRFDMRGHGESVVNEPFSELLLSQWFEDCQRALTELTEDPQILVGSSMGGWMALLLARAFPERVKHIVGVAAAPDFTKRIPQRGVKVEGGYAFGDDSFASDAFIEDGNRLCLLDNGMMDIHCPVTLLQGKEDDVVPWQLAEAIKAHLPDGQCETIYLDKGDHRLNCPEGLETLQFIVAKQLT